MKGPLLCVLCLCLCQVTDGKVNFPVNTLGMNPDALDDQYEGCVDEMENWIATSLLEEEKLRDSDFKKAWNNATLAWPAKKRSLTSLPKGFKDNHGIALMAYTNMDIPLYRRFNKAVREFRAPYKNFPFKTLHLYLTTALQLLRSDCHGTPHKVYRGFSGVQFQHPNILEQNIRLGQFTSVTLDLNVAKSFGNSAIFSLSTCFGVDIQKFSYYPEQKELLIPMDEQFQVTQFNEKGNMFLIKSTQKRCHYYNCVFLKDFPTNRHMGMSECKISRAEYHYAKLARCIHHSETNRGSKP
ncbi:ecto-ADP-ribosyltransferase 5-like isoform X2 [Ambystoma mexicanum]|uniref:ecto-ADP-ribosyltransferase 5-like isoform X2 n=1 Tax=Ambystoma mexicanum TaxID=8296 RepID=UPI0037E9C517